MNGIDTCILMSGSYPFKSEEEKKAYLYTKLVEQQVITTLPDNFKGVSPQVRFEAGTLSYNYQVEILSQAYDDYIKSLTPQPDEED